MTYFYNCVAVILAILEILQVYQISTKSHGVMNQFYDYVHSVSYVNTKATNSKKNDNETTLLTGHQTLLIVDTLIQWIVMGKLCLALALVGSTMIEDPMVRTYFSVGFTVVLTIPYISGLRPCLLETETYDAAILSNGTVKTIDIFMFVFGVLLAISSILEIKEMLLL